jgi:hypothetical protein
MAKRNKVLPARKQRDRPQDEESLLMRSAESLGRMIGSLQRQLDGATRRLSETADDVMDRMPDIPLVGGEDARRGVTKRKKKKTGTRKRAARKGASPARTGRARTRAASRSSKKR